MLSDGTKLAVGDWISTPVKALAQSPEFHPNPLDFHGFRFAADEALAGLFGEENEFLPVAKQPESSKLVDVEQSWQVWGFGRMAWCVALLTSPPPPLPFEMVEMLT